MSLTERSPPRTWIPRSFSGDQQFRDYSMNSFIRQLGQSIRQPEFWAYSSWLDIVTKYRRTRLGLLWVLLPTVVFTLVLGNFYAQLMGRDRAHYLPYLVIGYSIWRLLVQVTNESVSVLRGHKPFIMDGRVRLTDFTLRAIAKGMFYYASAFLVVLAVFFWSPETHWFNLLTVVVTLPILLANLVWWSYCTALMGARYPDAGELVGTALMLGFLLTPILWEGARFPADTIGGVLIRLNPAYHLIEIVREPMLGHMPARSTLAYIAVMTLGGWLMALILHRRYARFVPLWI